MRDPAGRGPLGAAPDIVAAFDAPEEGRTLVARAAGSVAGHESDPCQLDDPLVGRFRCGKWLLFAGVRDLMHAPQLRAIAAARLPEVTA
jgi:hypothetical protein